MAKVLNRINVFNGNKYTAEPAIFGWNILNEPRNPASDVVPGEPNSGEVGPHAPRLSASWLYASMPALPNMHSDNAHNQTPFRIVCIVAQASDSLC